MAYRVAIPRQRLRRNDRGNDVHRNTDKLGCRKKYLPDIFSQVTDFLKSIDPETIEPGTYPIQGNEIFAKIECGSGKSEAERRFELHHKYIDVQMLLTGFDLEFNGSP
ncbi:YhcH/YjgK/YiaL family protein [Desulfovibrio piger]|uniref:YhcH/YjgK/YiaL family protein n=1 Tax=Desulfovibrio piger TaxID=901 RepID=UPI002665A96D|nr:YhcH/YjgK/YiaL family protein [Desulfovibrio piger]